MQVAHALSHERRLSAIHRHSSSWNHAIGLVLDWLVQIVGTLSVSDSLSIVDVSARTTIWCCNDLRRVIACKTLSHPVLISRLRSLLRLVDLIVMCTWEHLKRAEVFAVYGFLGWDHIVIRDGLMEWSTSTHSPYLHRLIRYERSQGCWEDTLTNPDRSRLIVKSTVCFGSGLLIQILDTSNFVQKLDQVSFRVIFLFKDGETFSHTFFISLDCLLSCLGLVVVEGVVSDVKLVLSGSRRGHINRFSTLTREE